MMELMERALMKEKRLEDLMRSTDGLHWQKLETISCCVVFLQLSWELLQTVSLTVPYCDYQTISHFVIQLSTIVIFH